jgi:VanZ like protein
MDPMTGVNAAFQTWAPVLAATVAGLPLAIVVATLLARRRTRVGGSTRQAWLTAVADVAIVVGTLPWLVMILTPRPGAGGVDLVPGVGITHMLAGGTGDAVVEIGGNLLVFATAGFVAPIRWPIRPATITGLAVAASAILECAQYALRLGRVSSIDDVILNALGAALAALASRPWRHAVSGR